MSLSQARGVRLGSAADGPVVAVSEEKLALSLLDFAAERCNLADSPARRLAKVDEREGVPLGLLGEVCRLATSAVLLGEAVRLT